MRLFFEQALQVRSNPTFWNLDDGLGSAACDNLSSRRPRFRADFHNVIRLCDEGGMVFDYHDRMAGVDETVEDSQELSYVRLVESDGWLFE